MLFVLQHHTYHGNQLMLHHWNSQWLLLTASIMALWTIFLDIIADALKLAERTGLSLPSYALHLMPWLCYKISPEDYSPSSPLQPCTLGGVISLVSLLTGSQIITQEREPASEL